MALRRCLLQYVVVPDSSRLAWISNVTVSADLRLPSLDFSYSFAGDFPVNMYGETGYHGAYAAGQSQVGSGMHRSPSAGKCKVLCTATGIVCLFSLMAIVTA